MKGELESNTLFLALTRPAHFMGVPLELFFINVIIAICTFVIAKNVFLALIWCPLHLSCVLLCRTDKQFFSVFLCKANLKRSGNRKFWQGVSYEPY